MSQFNIPAEVKNQILAERINTISLEGYQNELNLKTLEALGKGDSPEADAARENIAIIVNAIAVAQTELEGNE